MAGNRKSPGTARENALKALVRFETEGAFLNLMMPSLLRNLTAEDRSLAAHLAVGTVQRLNTLDWVINTYSRRSIDTFTPWIRNIVRLGAYQILYLDRIPDYAVVNEAVRLAGRFGHRGVAGLVNALLRKIAKQSESLPWPDRKNYPVEYLSLRHSMPQWLVSEAFDRWGFTETEQWCQANNKRTFISIRPNSLRINPEALIKKLSNENVEAFQSPVIPYMLRINRGILPTGNSSFREGLFTVQGESSALVAPLLKPQQGETIIDLCSAPGGKTTHLAELMEDRGLVYAVEINQNRLRMVKETAARLGLQSIRFLSVDGRDIDKQNLPRPASVLVDAPCSGLGVMRRLPEIKWRRCKQDLYRLQKLQLELLAAAARILPAGGKLLYAVCSNQSEETDQVVSAFNSSHPGFIPEKLNFSQPLLLQNDKDLAEVVHIWPHRHDLDGFFIALWRKKDQ